MSSTCYSLSKSADNDLDDIFDHTEKTFGFTQAEKYLNELEIAFNRLCDNHYLGRARDEIKLELRSLFINSHFIFYRILNDKIWIVRVLHKSRDMLQHL